MDPCGGLPTILLQALRTFKFKHNLVASSASRNQTTQVSTLSAVILLTKRIALRTGKTKQEHVSLVSKKCILYEYTLFRL